MELTEAEEGITDVPQTGPDAWRQVGAYYWVAPDGSKICKIGNGPETRYELWRGTGIDGSSCLFAAGDMSKVIRFHEKLCRGKSGTA